MQSKRFVFTSSLAILLAPVLASTSYAQFGFGGGFRGNPLRNAIRQGAPFGPPLPPAMAFPPTPFARGAVIIGPPGLPVFPRIRRSATITVQPRISQSPQASTPTYNQQPAYNQPPASQPPASQPPAVESLPSPEASGPTLAPPLPGGAQSGDVQEVRQLVAQARRSFELQRYAETLPFLNRVIELAPQDSDAFQFRSFVYFAMGDFEAAAADAYDALSLGNSWDWQTVYELYGNADTYTAQMRELETQARAEKTLSSHFLLGYHYVVLGHYSRGRNEFKKMLVIQPDEPMATALIDVLDGLIAQSPGK